MFELRVFKEKQYSKQYGETEEKLEGIENSTYKGQKSCKSLCNATTASIKFVGEGPRRCNYKGTRIALKNHADHTKLE